MESRYHAYTAIETIDFRGIEWVFKRRVSTIKFEFQNGGWLLFSVFKEVIFSKKCYFYHFLAKDMKKDGSKLEN